MCHVCQLGQAGAIVTLPAAFLSPQTDAAALKTRAFILERSLFSSAKVKLWLESGMGLVFVCFGNCEAAFGLTKGCSFSQFRSILGGTFDSSTCSSKASGAGTGGLAGAEHLQLFGWGARNVFEPAPQLEESWSSKK